MSDGIYTCDVDDYMWLLSKQDGNTTTSHQDWFYWWLADNGIDYMKIDYVCYNELQQTIYVNEIDEANQVRAKGGFKLRDRDRGVFSMKDYPVVEDPPAILLDRWDWLMEEIRGDERALCTAG